MGKGNIRIIHLLLIGIAALIITYGCVQKSEFVFPPTKLKIQVLGKVSNTTSIFKKVKVGLFSDSAVYAKAVWDYDFAKADLIQVSDLNGIAHFDSISSQLKYYVLCRFDSITAQGDTISWSNTSENYQFLNPLKENTVTTAQVFISAADGFVNFWTENTFVLKQPIYVRLGLGGVLFDTIAIVDKIQKDFGDKVKMRVGSYQFSAKSDFGCAWQGAFDVVPSTVVDYNLETCNMIRVTVGVLTNTTSKFPIKVVLNSNDTVAVLRAPISATSPIMCGMANSLLISRPSGTYNVQFIASDKSVVLRRSLIELGANGLACDTLIAEFK